MPRGDKSLYSASQKRKAAHIEESYRHLGMSREEAEALAWATVNRQAGGGERKGGGPQRLRAACGEDPQGRLSQSWRAKPGTAGGTDPRAAARAGQAQGHQRSLAHAQGRADRGALR